MLLTHVTAFNKAITLLFGSWVMYVYNLDIYIYKYICIYASRRETCFFMGTRPISMTCIYACMAVIDARVTLSVTKWARRAAATPLVVEKFNSSVLPCQKEVMYTGQGCTWPSFIYSEKVHRKPKYVFPSYFGGLSHNWTRNCITSLERRILHVNSFISS